MCYAKIVTDLRPHVYFELSETDGCGSMNLGMRLASNPRDTP